MEMPQTSTFRAADPRLDGRGQPSVATDASGATRSGPSAERPERRPRPITSPATSVTISTALNTYIG